MAFDKAADECYETGNEIEIGSIETVPGRPL